MPIRFGLDRLLAEPDLRKPLSGKRIALLAHPASVTADLTHALDALAALPDLHLTAAFGPQHGLRGDKQDNMSSRPTFLTRGTASRSSACTAKSAGQPQPCWTRSTCY